MPYGGRDRDRSNQAMRDTCGNCGGPNTGAHKTYCKQCYSNYQRTYKAIRNFRHRAASIVNVSGEGDWQDLAACKGKQKLMFQFGDSAQRSVADKVCIGLNCPVIKQCLEYALTNNLDDGVWGGTTEIERRRLLLRSGRRLNPDADAYRLSESSVSDNVMAK